jgi:DNA topoisomerase IB
MNKKEAEASKCWDCKWGMCIYEEEEDNVTAQEDEDEELSFTESQIPQQYTIKSKHISCICYWRPDGIENAPPVRVARVIDCNRYNKEK